MRKIGERLRELRDVVRLHTNWFAVALLGKDAVSAEELQELVVYGKLPLDEALDLAKKSYILGRLQATLKSSDYKKLSYEEVADAAELAHLTALEEYAVEQAKLHAAEGLKGLSDEVAAGVFNRLKDAVNSTVSESSVRSIIQDHTAIALTEKQPYQQLASTLAKELKTASGRNWQRVAATEMHRAKQIGTVQAIVNKLGPYKHSDGPDSMVRIIPNLDTCEDCSGHYLENGEPRVFRLSEILQAGSNADTGVKHTREGGRHAHWKTTLPPLHPGCGCRIEYSPGSLSKAVGDAPISAASKGSGSAPSVKVDAAPTPASIPGVAAPGNVAGPGRPSGTEKTQVAGTGKTMPASSVSPEGQPEEMVDCPFGGGASCKKHGGNGYKTHKADGAIMAAHQEALDNGATPDDPEAAQELVSKDRAAADAYSKYPPNDQQVLKDIVEIRDTKEGISEEDMAEAVKKGITGVSDSFKVRIKDNGHAAMKPGTVYDDKESGVLAGGDLGQCPVGEFHNHEASAFDYSLLLGSAGSVPVATTRSHEGKPVSMAAWAEGFNPLGSQLHASGARLAARGNNYKALLDSAPEGNRDALKQKVDEIICLSTASNGGDDHSDNWVVNSNFSDVRKIDNGASFGNSMFGSKNSMLMAAAKNSADGMFQMPDHVVSRMSTMSLGDMQKGLPKLQDWQVGQQFMRQQYMLHLQEANGGLDPEYFLGTWANPRGNSAMLRPTKAASAPVEGWGKNQGEATQKFYGRKQARQLPHQMFDSFCKQWMQDAAGDEKHPHHEAAKELNDLGIFMPAGYSVEETFTARDGTISRHSDGSPVTQLRYRSTMQNPSRVREDGLHKKYADTIRAEYPPLRGELSGHRLGGGLATLAGRRQSTEGASPAPPGNKTVAATPLYEQESKKGTVKNKTVAATPLYEQDSKKGTVKKGVRLFLDLTKAW